MRSAWYGVVTALALAVIGTLAVASVLLLTRYAVYEVPSGATRSALPAGTHVLVDRDAGLMEGDVVVFHGSAWGAGDHVARVVSRDAQGVTLDSGGPTDGTAAQADVVGPVTRHGSLLSVVAFVLERAALLAVPVAVLLGLLAGLVLGARRRPQPVGAVVEDAPVEAPVDHAPVEVPVVDVTDEPVVDAGLELVLSGAVED